MCSGPYYIVDSRQIVQNLLALAWLISHSACSNVYDSHLGSHTHGVLPIGANEITVLCFCIQNFGGKKSLIFFFVLLGPETIFNDFSGSNWQYIIGMWPYNTGGKNLSTCLLVCLKMNIVLQLPVTKWPGKDCHLQSYLRIYCQENFQALKCCFKLNYFLLS